MVNMKPSERAKPISTIIPLIIKKIESTVVV